MDKELKDELLAEAAARNLTYDADLAGYSLDGKYIPYSSLVSGGHATVSDVETDLLITMMELFRLKGEL
jgi:hypothetical protein